MNEQDFEARIVALEKEQSLQGQRLSIAEDKIKDHKEYQSVKNKEYFDRLATLEKDGTRNDEKLDRIEKSVSEIQADIKEIKNKPSKRWDGVIDKILTIVLSAIGAALLFWITNQ